jgi:hypothetical protein
MAWEYRQLQVQTEGFFAAKIPEACYSEINTLAEGDTAIA